MNIKPIWLKYAIYYFGISFILNMIPYYVGALPGWLSFIVSLAIMYFISKMMIDDVKEEQGSPFMTYGEVFKNLFLMFTVGSFMFSWLNAVWINFIDPSVKEIIVEQAKESAEYFANLFGAPEGSMDEALDKIEDDTFSRLEFGSNMLYSLLIPIGTAIFAAIFALFFRKDEPIESQKFL
jgi:hypothetical protein